MQNALEKAAASEMDSEHLQASFFPPSGNCWELYREGRAIWSTETKRITIC